MVGFRRSTTIFAILVFCVLVTAGCRRRKSSNSTTVVNGTDIFTTDFFPGAPVQTHNVADDLRGWSPSGLDVDLGSLRITPNGDRGTMMATYTVTSDIAALALVYGQYFDGTLWTPPVALNGPDMVTATVSMPSVIHAWINTGDHAEEEARDRDGDCVILFLASDVITTGIVGDDANTNVYSVYFRSDDRESVALRHGFQEFASRLSSQDGTGENVRTLGVASDGLCGEARFNNTGNNYKWGQETTSIIVYWQQREDNDGAAGFEDRALYSRQIQLDASISDDVPLVPGAGMGAETRVAVASLGASDSGASSEETQVDEDFVSYNATAFFRLVANNTTGGDDDPSAMLSEVIGFDNAADFAMSSDGVIECVTFDLSSGAPSAAVVLHGAAVLATDALLNNGGLFLSAPGTPASFLRIPGGCYGPDEGLACIVAFNIEFQNDADGLQDVANSFRIAVSEIDVGGGGLISHGVVDAETPAFTDFIGQVTGMQSRISRNGDYVILQWFEAQLGGVGDLSIKAAEYLTTRPDDDGSFSIPILSISVSTPVTVNADIDGVSILNATFQGHLGYICGIQSDPDVMNLIYEHSNATNDTLFVARLTASVVPPAALVSVVSALETEDDGLWGFTGFNDSHLDWGITDSGEGGNIFAAYVRDIVSGAGTDFRLFAEMTGVGGGLVQIDSVNPVRQVDTSQALVLLATPPGDNIGTFNVADLEEDEDRAHAADRVHVFFRENRATEDSNTGLAFRTRVFHTEDRDTPFADNFVPNAGSEFLPPFALELPNIDPIGAEDVITRGFAVDGNTVGVYFTELGHVYYQEYNDGGGDGLGWANVDDASNPFLVDDDDSNESNSGEPESFFELFVTRTCGCDTLAGSTVFWSKTADDFSSAGRFQTRTRD